MNSENEPLLHVSLPFKDLQGESQILSLNNPFGGTLLLGHAGWGKSSIILNILNQHMAQGFGICLFEDQYGQLTGEVQKALTLNKNAYLSRYGRLPELIKLNLEDFKSIEPMNALLDSDMVTPRSALYTARRLLRMAMEVKEKFQEVDSDHDNRCFLLAGMLWYLKQHDNLNQLSVNEKGKTTFCTIAHLMVFINSPSSKVIACLKKLPEFHNFLNQFPDDQLENKIWMLLAELSFKLSILLSSDFVWLLGGPEKDLAINRLECPRIICIGYNDVTDRSQHLLASLIIDMIYKQSNPSISGQNTPRIPSAFILDQRVCHHLAPRYMVEPTNKEYQIAIYATALHIYSLSHSLGKARLTGLLRDLGQLMIGNTDYLTSEGLLKILPEIGIISLDLPDDHRWITKSRDTQHLFWFKTEDCLRTKVTQGSFKSMLRVLVPESVLQKPEQPMQGFRSQLRSLLRTLKARLCRTSKIALPVPRSKTTPPFIEDPQKIIFKQVINAYYNKIQDEVDTILVN